MRVFGDCIVSEVDGPGLRAVVHFAGCSLRCPGCFNRSMRPTVGRQMAAAELADELLALAPAVTISGGEPTDQLESLRELLQELRKRGCRDIVLFSGRTLRELNGSATWHAIVDNGLLDVLIDGRFVADRVETRNVTRGSDNQRVICLTDRWKPEDFNRRGVQVHVAGDRLVVTGFPTEELTEALSHVC